MEGHTAFPSRAKRTSLFHLPPSLWLIATPSAQHCPHGDASRFLRGCVGTEFPEKIWAKEEGDVVQSKTRGPWVFVHHCWTAPSPVTPTEHDLWRAKPVSSKISSWILCLQLQWPARENGWDKTIIGDFGNPGMSFALVLQPASPRAVLSWWHSSHTGSFLHPGSFTGS